MIAAVPLGCYFPSPCCLALLSWRCCFEASVDPFLPLCLSMSSLTHVLLLCVPPSAFGGCPSPPWKEKKKQKKTQNCYISSGIWITAQHYKKKFHVGLLITFNLIIHTEKRPYLSCRRQLWRLLSGSLLTEVEGFSNSSSREAGTGQSGILTGVTGVDGFPSLFSSMRCCSNNNNNKTLSSAGTSYMALYLQYWPLHLCKRQNACITHTVKLMGTPS